MSHDELIGTYMRLRQELALAYAAPSWNKRQIDRLANDIARIERAIVKNSSDDEQTDDAVLGVLPVFSRSGSVWADSAFEA